MEKRNIADYQVWFVTGSQHLYGPKTLEQVKNNSETIAKALSSSAKIPVQIVLKPVVKTPAEIMDLCSEDNNNEKCIGLITWMHTFSPSKMWILESIRFKNHFCICILSLTVICHGPKLIWIL